MILVKTKIKKLIVENLGNGIKNLGKIIDPGRLEIYNSFLTMQSNFYRIEEDRILQKASQEYINQAIATLTKNFLDFVDTLHENDLNDVQIMQDEIYERILVVTKSKERRQYMKSFFPVEYFRNVEYDDSRKPVLAGKYDVIVYDDNPGVKEGETDSLLLHYLENEGPVLLYFGRHSPLVWKYPEKAYAANSVFSIHARIKELIEYLKYKKAFQSQQNHSN